MTRPDNANALRAELRIRGRVVLRGDTVLCYLHRDVITRRGQFGRFRDRITYRVNFTHGTQHIQLTGDTTDSLLNKLARTLAKTDRRSASSAGKDQA